MPESVRDIGAYAFEGCNMLTTANMSTTTVKNAEEGVFRKCPNLINISLPKCLTKIGNNAFEETGITELELPESVKIIGSDAFKNCRKLKTVCMSTTAVKDIQSSTFRNCINLTLLSLPEGLLNIYRDAFRDCQNLRTLNFPRGIEFIAIDAFAGTGIKVSRDGESFISVTYDKGKESELEEGYQK